MMLKKFLRISDEMHLECLEKAMTEKKSRGGGEGGKKSKAGGYGASDKPTKKRKSVDKASKKVSRIASSRPPSFAPPREARERSSGGGRRTYA